MALGVDTELVRRQTKPRTASGVIDPTTQKWIDHWHVGSDLERFAISKDGKFLPQRDYHLHNNVY
jgi:hypothetical protein